jgi:hypothetical protein
MTQPKFSDFTLNFNPNARGNDKAPTLKGRAKVQHGTGATEYDVAAWGPQKASTGGPDYYNVTLTPRDPALAARQVKTDLAGPIRNAPNGFELKSLGTGRIFERGDDELNAAAATGNKPPKFYGHGLVLLDGGELAYIDLSAWHRKEHGFYSGNANLHDPAAAATARATKTAEHG